jgi:hypothetical protein
MRTLVNRRARVKSLAESPRDSRWQIVSPVSAFVSVLWPLLLVGCASIESFQASPRNLCAGDTVTVTWQATGHVSLDANPSLSHTGPKDSQGSEPFTLQQTTRFVLSAHSLFSQKTADADVVVVANTPKEFGGLASCDVPSQGLTLTLPLQDPQVSPAMRVTSVTNMNARPILLRKENVQVTLLPGETSSAFDHLPAQGTWIVTSTLNQNESCADGLSAVHDRLTFRIAFSCRD